MPGTAAVVVEKGKGSLTTLLEISSATPRIVVIFVGNSNALNSGGDKH